MRNLRTSEMSPEQIEGIRLRLDALELENQDPLPSDPRERLSRLTKSHHFEHGIQELVLNSMEDNWHQQQVARAEIHGA